jgi:hypothetical protein
MTPDIVVVPAVFGIVALTAQTWFKHRERMATLKRPAAPAAAIEARLEQLEQSVEAIAVEMERVGEGQRFLTRILSERTKVLGDAPSSSRGQVITPH